jgi:hypothetical protein
LEGGARGEEGLEDGARGEEGLEGGAGGNDGHSVVEPVLTPAEGVASHSGAKRDTGGILEDIVRLKEMLQEASEETVVEIGGDRYAEARELAIGILCRCMRDVLPELMPEGVETLEQYRAIVESKGAGEFFRLTSYLHSGRRPRGASQVSEEFYLEWLRKMISLCRIAKGGRGERVEWLDARLAAPIFFIR